MKLSTMMVVIALSILTALAAPVSAGGTTQISGDGVVLGFGAACGPDGETSDPNGVTIELTAGDLVGCWFTDEITYFQQNPSGTVQERGRETFKVYNDDDELVGSFNTTYKFTGKFLPDFTEVHGRCQHPIVAGSGTGIFEGVTGRVDFKDIDPENGLGILEYRGHITNGS